MYACTCIIAIFASMGKQPLNSFKKMSPGNWYVSEV